MTDKTRQILLAARPSGQAKLSDFKFREVPLPSPSDGELLPRGCFLSLDPYLRGRIDDRESYANPSSVGDVMPGQTICVVEASHHPEYKPVDVVLAPSGWQTKFVCGSTGLRKVDAQVAPMSAYLGVLGTPGFTAYAGLRVIDSRSRETRSWYLQQPASSARRAGQLAIIAGARAVGIAGGANKCAFVKEELGFNTAVDYQATGFPEALALACPDGIDIYFENVGGEVWQAVLPLLNQFARVPLSGIIALLGRATF